ncbi:hypothetical protein HNP55_000742 [Paucibacter oligotrophus]|uniref:DUF6916 domain-containing protein n=1 Tax=Roseateles oligotrophus TaxID=1769250 RepID=A0A840LA51_9BURK|nr:hypothetical protein [Roseateles oligotrophus]MBB4842247.1 hypothetical protein [Roseateles oligotrophus]
MELSQFQARLGQSYELPDMAVPLKLSLQEAQALPAAASPGQAFSLLFAGPASPALEQGLYRLRSAPGGAAEAELLELFLVPIAADAQSRHYEAIFN